jgi:hypothetical protein
VSRDGGEYHVFAVDVQKKILFFRTPSEYRHEPRCPDCQEFPCAGPEAPDDSTFDKIISFRARPAA